MIFKDEIFNKLRERFESDPPMDSDVKLVAEALLVMVDKQNAATRSEWSKSLPGAQER